MSKEIPFEPFYFANDPHKQAIINTFFNFLLEPGSDQQLVLLPDGDRISLEISTPEEWRRSDLTVVLVHGLCGSQSSPNIVRMAKRLIQKGIRVVRFNMRGCGSGRGLAKKMYHCGRSDDLFAAIKTLKKEIPESPIVLVGFSLGANIVLKMAGELHKSGRLFLRGVVAVSPPIDIASSIEMLGDPINDMYERYFMKLLKADVLYRHRRFRDLGAIQFSDELKMIEFDRMYTVPSYGFRDIHDYYSKCSAEHVVSDISVPCRILLAEDDPIVSSTAIDRCVLPQHVSVFKTKHGGHMGYIASPTDERGFYWLDTLVDEWIRDLGSLS